MVWINLLISSSHHLFENIHLFHAQQRLDICPYIKSIHISLNTVHSGYKPSNSISSLTHPPPSLLALTPTIHPCQLNTCTLYRPTPNNYTVTLQMLTTSQSATPHHLSHTRNMSNTVQIVTLLTILPTHPSHHHLLCPFKTMQIFSLHRSCFSRICQHTLVDTSSVYLSIYNAPQAVSMGDNSLNSAQAPFHSSSNCLLHTNYCNAILYCRNYAFILEFFRTNNFNTVFFINAVFWLLFS